MIKHMLSNLGFMFSALGRWPKKATNTASVLPDSRLDIISLAGSLNDGRFEHLVIAESFYSPIRRTDLL
jgi:hypothetical protein